jgi:hypothetical protein
MVSSRGIDANPKKVEVIEQLQPSRTRKEIQKMSDMMVTLSRFQWDDQAAAAFIELKQ